MMDLFFTQDLSQKQLQKLTAEGRGGGAESRGGGQGPNQGLFNPGHSRKTKTLLLPGNGINTPANFINLACIFIHHQQMISSFCYCVLGFIGECHHSYKFEGNTGHAIKTKCCFALQVIANVPENSYDLSCPFSYYLKKNSSFFSMSRVSVTKI
jgi:hypothetical protein